MCHWDKTLKELNDYIKNKKGNNIFGIMRSDQFLMLTLDYFCGCVFNDIDWSLFRTDDGKKLTHLNLISYVLNNINYENSFFQEIMSSFEKLLSQTITIEWV